MISQAAQADDSARCEDCGGPADHGDNERVQCECENTVCPNCSVQVAGESYCVRCAAGLLQSKLEASERRSKLWLAQAAAWRCVAHEIVGLDPCSTAELVLDPAAARAHVLDVHRKAKAELDEERASGCEQDMCGQCSGCVERARYAFERGESVCYCCSVEGGEHKLGVEGCIYAESYDAKERAEHMAIGLDYLDQQRAEVAQG